jgi:LysR family transcriptional regulator, glycine cleavage system transcriptional activator
VSKMPPLNAVRAFEVAARRLSFRAAAEELFVTPGAVSRQIHNLEAFLGTRLFLRGGRQVELTRHGESYLVEVREGLERLVRATSALTSRLDEQVLRLKLPPTCAMRWLVPRLGGFRRENPDIQVQVSASHDDVAFGREDVDVAVHYGAKINDGLAGERLFGEVLLPVCSAEVMRRTPVVQPRDLAARVLLHSSRRPKDWPHWFTAAGVEDIEIPQELVLENSTFTCQAAMEGLGIALAQAAFVADEISSGRLVSPIKLPMPTEFGYYLVYPQEGARHRKIRLFQAWVAKEAAITRRRGQIEVG